MHTYNVRIYALTKLTHYVYMKKLKTYIPMRKEVNLTLDTIDVLQKLADKDQLKQDGKGELKPYMEKVLTAHAIKNKLKKKKK